MKVSGIICEYNPFHNGHLHHIEETRRNGATHIAAVMSGNFVQRGETAVIDKHTRARLAVECGADLVIELPVQYCLASAEYFARGGVWLLNSLGAVDELSFGSECGDIAALLGAADTTERIRTECAEEIKRMMENGYTYPRALSEAVRENAPEAAEMIAEPNNLLGIEYIRALREFSSEIEPYTVKRESAMHNDDHPTGNMASAGFIRENIIKNSNGADPYAYMPEVWADEIVRAASEGRIAATERLERVILYKLRTASTEEISRINDVGQGLEYRIAGAREAASLDELLEAVKTKRYTLARIKRIMMSLILGITREDMEHLPPYGRILAMNGRGREILARAKGRSKVPYAGSLARLGQQGGTAARFAELEGRAGDIFGLALADISQCRSDFREKMIVNME